MYKNKFLNNLECNRRYDTMDEYPRAAALIAPRYDDSARKLYFSSETTSHAPPMVSDTICINLTTVQRLASSK